MDASSPLLRALHLTSLELHYQGQYRLGDGRIDGYEALLRATDVSGPVAPPRLVERADSAGFGADLALWTLDTALEASDVLARGKPAAERPKVRVNFMETELTDPDFIRAVIDRLPPKHAVEIELVETRRHGDLHILTRHLEKLKAAGARIWMDDYTGAGSDLARLLATDAIDGVKLDKGLMHASEYPSQMRALKRLKGMLEGGGLEVLTEGIETPSHFALARTVGFRLGQGYQLHRPAALEFCAVHQAEREQRANARETAHTTPVPVDTR